MKKFITALICTVIFISVSAPAFSQAQSIQDFQKAIDVFSEEVSLAMPFNSTIGLNWSDAYIGKLFPSMPPHFGVGFSAGFTTLGMRSINGVLNSAGANNNAIPSYLRNRGMPLPAYTAEARIGGFFLPFDIGVKFGILPLEQRDFELDYLLIGFDIRYAVIDKALSPVKLSIGVGYNYLKGGASFPIDSFEFEVPGNGVNYNIMLQDPKIGFLWETKCFELKGQLSFKIPIITPYAGTGLSVAFSKAGYEFKTKLTDGGGNEINDDIKNAMQALGISGISNDGFSSIKDTTSFNIRLFGGISLNLLAVRLDLTASYNLTGGNYGLTFGGRFQL